MPIRLFALTLATVLVLTTSALAQDATRDRATITVTGTGEAERKPDFAQIRVTVGSEADKVAQAVDANRAASERVLTRILGLGITREDIRTENFQVFRTPRYGRDGREQPVPRFTARHQLVVISRDIDGIGRLTGEILASGDMTFQSLVWGLEREDQAMDEARREAVSNARRQAEVYANAAGVKLGRVLVVRGGSAGATERLDARGPAIQAAPAAASDVPIVPPATVRYEASVELIFEIAP
jgi:uncharacterized protein